MSTPAGVRREELAGRTAAPGPGDIGTTASVEETLAARPLRTTRRPGVAESAAGTRAGTANETETVGATADTVIASRETVATGKAVGTRASSGTKAGAGMAGSGASARPAPARALGTSLLEAMGCRTLLR